MGVSTTTIDVSLFQYRELNYEKAMENIYIITCEVKKLHGIFTLLWHNSYFEEERLPGIRKLYQQLISYIDKDKLENETGRELLQRAEHRMKNTNIREAFKNRCQIKLLS
jgi:hypothetical protein